MAWDTARTRQLLLDAAVEEYARYGPDGARLDRIAAAAGVNKERIYQHLGNKQELFAIVLRQELETIAAAVPLTVADGADLGAYAGRIFDYHQQHPHFVRLLLWEGLHSDSEVVGQTARAGHYARKVATLSAAQEAGTLTTDLRPGYLLYAIIALAAWWTATPQLLRLLTADIPDDSPAARRRALVHMVRRLATA